MYQIIRSSNDIVQLEERMFGDLGFRERDHLQEWIAKNPEVLGEELLIIQKEFDGFSDTNERLDLLALDKEGNIVVIENKLDDTGKDVVWQALKYASYCSTLSTSQIVGIFQKFLDKQDQPEDARTAIIDFMGIESEESMVLNRNDQRIMFVANHYRKEVTSTVLWLLDHDLAIQCFKATPYSLGDDLFLQVDQIIPVPEVSEFIIDIKEKEKEDKAFADLKQKLDDTKRKLDNAEAKLTEAEKAKAEAEAANSVRNRPQENIRLTTESLKSSFNKLYSRELRKDPFLEGVLLLELVIEPSGEVSFCRVVTSELNSPDFESKIVSRMYLADFGEANVLQTTIQIPFPFKPN